MTQLPAPAAAGPARVDWAGESFRVFAALGERPTISFGRIRDGAAEWTELPHADHDGVGGFAHLLRERGLAAGELPALARPERPGALRTLWALLRADPSAERVPPVRWRRFDASRRFAADRAPPRWRLLAAEETARVERRADALGVSANSLLLAALDAAVGSRVVEGEAPSLWMVPVNMRGAVAASRDTANQSAYLPVRLARGATPAAAHAEVKARFASRVHWAVWAQFSLGRWVGRAFYARALRAYYERPGHPWVGAFTNIGAWPRPGGDDDAALADGFVLAPPPLKTVPLAAGALTWRGRLGLALDAHPALTEDAAEVAAWLDAWVEAALAS